MNDFIRAADALKAARDHIETLQDELTDARMHLVASDRSRNYMASELATARAQIAAKDAELKKWQEWADRNENDWGVR